MMCFGILIMFCQQPSPQAIDSYCQVYQRVVQQKGDGTIVATADAKRRILANELTYKKLCSK